MFHLLQLEWKKVRKYRMFRVMAIMYLITLPALLIAINSFQKPPSSVLPFEMDNVMGFPMLAYIGGNWLVFFFLGFISVIMITHEFQNKTLRQNIITGLSRKEFFLAKFSFIVALSFAATAYFTIVGFVTGLFYLQDYSSAFTHIHLIPRYFLLCIAYMSYGFFLGLLIRRTGIALFVYLAYGMFVELILRYALHLKIATNKTVHFYPMNAVEDLCPANFFGETVSTMLENAGVPVFLSPIEAIVTTIFYVSLFLFLTYRTLSRKDL